MPPTTTDHGSRKSQTQLTSLSHAEIRRQAAKSHVRDLRDARNPGVYIRIHQNPERGTCHLVGGNKWDKSAGYPALPVKGLINAQPKIR
ncbi:hypothetical protein VSS92_28315, partial [Pseudomonas syringae pv. tagetis]